MAASALAVYKMRDAHLSARASGVVLGPLLEYLRVLARWSGVRLEQVLEFLEVSQDDLEVPRQELVPKYADLGVYSALIATSSPIGWEPRSRSKLVTHLLDGWRVALV